MSDDREPRPSTAPGPGLTGLVVLAVLALGAPQVWSELRAGSPGLGSVYFPVLGAALGYLAVSRRTPR